MTKEQALSKLQLNPRLLQIARLVPNCKAVADIGTDHGYIPIFSVLAGLCERAIASDINKGPIRRAEENVKAFCLEDKISLRLGGGLETVKPNEADVVVIAGMGGILISNILEASNNIVRNAKLLILQPMTAVIELRQYLSENNYEISAEHLEAEEEKIYNILVAKPGGNTQYTLKELYLGKGLYETSPNLVERYKTAVLTKLNKRVDGLKKSRNPENETELKKTLNLLKILNER